MTRNKFNEELKQLLNSVRVMGVNLEDTLDKVIVNEAADSESAREYANILAVQSGELETDKTKALVEALTSDETREFINTQYEDQFIPVF